MSEELKQLKAENEQLKKDVERLRDELIRLVSRNLDLSERLEYDVELRRRTEVARELLEGNIQRQLNADLKDDAQLMALIELRVESDRPHLKPDFNSTDLARLLDVSHERLVQLFRHQTIHHCVCCVRSHSTTSLWWQRRQASATCAPFSAAFRTP